MTFGVENVFNGGAALVSDVLSFSVTVTSANKIVVAVTWGYTVNTAIIDVTRNGQTFTQIVQKNDGSPFEHAALFYLDSPNAGTSDVAVHFGATPNQWWAGAATLLDAASGCVDFSSNSGSSSAPSTTVAGTANGDIVISALATDLGPDGATSNTGSTIYDAEDIGSDSDFASQYQTASGPNTACSWSSPAVSGGEWANAAAAFRSATPLPSANLSVPQAIQQPILLGFAS